MRNTISKPSAIAADYVAIAAFALLARAAHQSDEMPFNFSGWLSTLWPRWLLILGVVLMDLLVVSDEYAHGAGAEARGLLNLKGHRSVGGMRASIYNAVGLDAVEALVAYMAEFEKEHG